MFLFKDFFLALFHFAFVIKYMFLFNNNNRVFVS